MNLSNRSWWLSRSILQTLKSWSLTRIRRLRDGLRVVRRKHPRLVVKAHSIWSTTLRKIRVISPPWIKETGIMMEVHPYLLILV